MNSKRNYRAYLNVILLKMTQSPKTIHKLELTLLVIIIIITVQTFLCGCCLAGQNQHENRWLRAHLSEIEGDPPEDDQDYNQTSYIDRAVGQIDALNPTKCGRANFPHNWMKKLNSYTCSNEQQSLLDTNESARFATRIAGGYEPKSGDFPSIVQIVYLDSPDSIFCTGVLIHSDLVLTAAHCVEEPSSGYRVYVGSVSSCNKDNRAISVRVADYCISSNYLPGDEPENDWAVLKLVRPIKYSYVVQPVCMNFRRPPTRNVACVTAGFGMADDDMASPRLRASVMSRCRQQGVPATTCWEQIRPSSWSGNTCEGDSGSPMYCFDTCSKNEPTMHLVGVLSTGTNKHCGKHLKDYSFFTDIHKQAKSRRMQEILFGCIRKLRDV